MAPISAWLQLLCIWQVATYLASAVTVQNLRFVDTDTDAGEITGEIRWESEISSKQYVPGTSTKAYKYALYLSTDSSGTTKTLLGTILAGAWSLVFSVPSNTDIATASYAYILVYLQDAAGTDSEPAFIRILDEPNTRTYYALVVGRSDANNAKAALVSNEDTQEPLVTLREVATTVYNSSTGVADLTTFDFYNHYYSQTSCFTVSFPSDRSITTVQTRLTAYTDSVPFDIYHTGNSHGDTSYRMGVYRASSPLGDLASWRADLDVGSSLAKSLVHNGVAYAVTLDRDGEMRIQTKSAQETGIQSLVDVFMGYETVTFSSDLGTATDNYANIDAACTQTTPPCHQVSGTVGADECVPVSELR